MPAVEKNSKADAFVQGAKHWQPALAALRRIALDSGLTEDWKWGKPCYTLEGRNVAILFVFKECAAIGFFKGAILADAAHILEKPGDNSQSMRMAKFTEQQAVAAMEPTLQAYLQEAIALEAQGAQVPRSAATEPILPKELLEQMEAMPALRDAFERLTPGRQRAYILHFGSAKQSATRAARVAKCIPLILEGKGLND